MPRVWNRTRLSGLRFRGILRRFDPGLPVSHRSFSPVVRPVQPVRHRNVSPPRSLRFLSSTQSSEFPAGVTVSTVKFRPAQSRLPAEFARFTLGTPSRYRRYVRVSGEQSERSAAPVEFLLQLPDGPFERRDPGFEAVVRPRVGARRPGFPFLSPLLPPSRVPFPVFSPFVLALAVPSAIVSRHGRVSTTKASANDLSPGGPGFLLSGHGAVP